MRRPNYSWLNPGPEKEKAKDKSPDRSMNPKTCRLARNIEANVTQSRLEEQMEMLKIMAERRKEIIREGLRADWKLNNGSHCVKNDWTRVEKSKKNEKNDRAEVENSKEQEMRNNVLHARAEFQPAPEPQVEEEFTPKTGPCFWSQCKLGRAIYFRTRRMAIRQSLISSITEDED